MLINIPLSCCLYFHFFKIQFQKLTLYKQSLLPINYLWPLAEALEACGLSLKPHQKPPSKVISKLLPSRSGNCVLDVV
jgi:hypothetical protein